MVIIAGDGCSGNAAEQGKEDKGVLYGFHKGLQVVVLFLTGVGVVVDANFVVVYNSYAFGLYVAVCFKEHDASVLDFVLEGLLDGLEGCRDIAGAFPFEAGAVGIELQVVDVVAIVVLPGSYNLAGRGGALGYAGSGDADKGKSEDKDANFHCLLMTS